MEEWLCRQNIERFREQLAETRDEQRRKTLRELLAEEEAKLERLTATVSETANNSQRKPDREFE